MADRRPFVRSAPTPNRALARQASPALDVTLTHDGRTRRYEIRRGRDVDEWYAQVWFEETQHRGDRLDGVAAAHRMQAEFMREIAESLKDGWTHG